MLFVLDTLNNVRDNTEFIDIKTRAVLLTILQIYTRTISKSFSMPTTEEIVRSVPDLSPQEVEDAMANIKKLKIFKVRPKPVTPEENFIKKNEPWKCFGTWLSYKKEKKQSYKGEMSIKTAYKMLQKLSENNEETAELIVERSIANNWAGLFALPEDYKKDVAKKQRPSSFHFWSEEKKDWVYIS